MQLIGILSDTHSCWDDRFAIHFKDCDQIWHAGDVGDMSVIERLRSVCPEVRAVRGNIDSGSVSREFPEVDSFEVEGVKVWLTHIGGVPRALCSRGTPHACGGASETDGMRPQPYTEGDVR